MRIKKEFKFLQDMGKDELIDVIEDIVREFELRRCMGCGKYNRDGEVCWICHNVKDTPTHIPVEECVHKGVYKVNARNFSYGIYNAENESFYGIRHKFGAYFIDWELHYDVSHGSAEPVQYVTQYDGAIDGSEKMHEFLERIVHEENPSNL